MRKTSAPSDKNEPLSTDSSRVRMKNNKPQLVKQASNIYQELDFCAVALLLTTFFDPQTVL
jgi:hypothetical protein